MYKFILKIVWFLLKILDKKEPRFSHRVNYVSIYDEIPEEEKIGRLRISDGEKWIDKAVWIGINNKHYSEVMKIIGKEE